MINIIIIFQQYLFIINIFFIVRKIIRFRHMVLLFCIALYIFGVFFNFFEGNLSHIGTFLKILVLFKIHCKPFFQKTYYSEILRFIKTKKCHKFTVYGTFRNYLFISSATFFYIFSAAAGTRIVSADLFAFAYGFVCVVRSVG